MPQDFRETGAVRPENGQQGSIQIPYPKFDLGKTSRQFDRPIRKVYATIDRDGRQAARTLLLEGGHFTFSDPPHRQSFWLDWGHR